MDLSDSSFGKLDLDPSLGELEADAWPSFVQKVLELTVKAYYVFRDQRVALQTWEEDTFTANIAWNLMQLTRGLELTWHISPQAFLLTSEILSGKQRSIEAKKIDIQINNDKWDYTKIYFAWEAKLIVLKHREDKHKGLLLQYIVAGIFRFIDANYSGAVPEAGMIGYILYDEPMGIVEHLNETMLTKHKTPKSQVPKRALTAAQSLRPDRMIGKLEAVYLSEHPRPTIGTPIKLHHLFLQFDFPPPTPPSTTSPAASPSTISPDPVDTPIAAKAKKPRRVSARRVN